MNRVGQLVRDMLRGTRVADLPVRLLACAALWWLITGGSAEAWLWGVPAILAAAIISPIPATTPWRISPGGVLRFIPVFVLLSLRSAGDVALRAVGVRAPLAPTLVDYPWCLPDASSRVFLANLINLMPGTLCVRITGHAMTVHTIGDTERAVAGIRRLETLTAGLFRRPSTEGALDA